VNDALEIGARYGAWTVVASWEGGAAQHRYRTYRVRCDCGAETSRGRALVIKAQVCRRCGGWGGGRSRPEVIERARAQTGMPAIDGETWTDDDPIALREIERRGPMTLEEIGAAMGVSRERIRQIEERARRRVAVGLAAAGCTEADVREWLMRSRPAHVLDISAESAPPGDAAPVRETADRDGYDAPARSWERGLDRAGRPERIAVVGFESELGERLERAVAELEVEAEIATLAASIAIECTEAAQ
jgi:hypothetical protein